MTGPGRNGGRRGRILIAGFLAGLAVFAAALWYFQTRAFYRDLPEQPLVVDGRTWPVETWSGIDASSSPLKLRACLTVTPETAAAILAGNEPRTGAEPLLAPGWFDCFDAARIGADLEAGRATALALGATDSAGIDAWLAIYPDGRVYKWHQLAPEYANQ